MKKQFTVPIALLAFTLLALTALYVSGCGDSQAKESKTLIAPYHQITKEDALHKQAEFVRHTEANTLIRIVHSEIFKRGEVLSLASLDGEDFEVIRGAYEDGQECSILRVGDFYLQKASLCPPLCPDNKVVRN